MPRALVSQLNDDVSDQENGAHFGKNIANEEMAVMVMASPGGQKAIPNNRIRSRRSSCCQGRPLPHLTTGACSQWQLRRYVPMRGCMYLGTDLRRYLGIHSPFVPEPNPANCKRSLIFLIGRLRTWGCTLWNPRLLHRHPPDCCMVINISVPRYILSYTR